MLNIIEYCIGFWVLTLQIFFFSVITLINIFPYDTLKYYNNNKQSRRQFQFPVKSILRSRSANFGAISALPIWWIKTLICVDCSAIMTEMKGATMTSIAPQREPMIFKPVWLCQNLPFPIPVLPLTVLPFGYTSWSIMNLLAMHNLLRSRWVHPLQQQSRYWVLWQSYYPSFRFTKLASGDDGLWRKRTC